MDADSSTVKRPLVSLVMIVKNEASNIRGVLDAAKPFIGRYTIIDTGSTDETVSIIKEAMADVPGQVVTGAFKGYATSRNEVLDLDATTQYGDTGRAAFQLMLSGDEYLRNGEGFVETLEEYRDGTKLAPDGKRVDLFAINVVLVDKRQFQTRVSRTEATYWRYKSELPKERHEFMADMTGQNSPVAAITNATIDHDPADPVGRIASVWDNDIPELEEFIVDNPEHPVALHYLGQSYTAILGNAPHAFSPGERLTLAMKAMSYFQRRLMIETGSPVERNYARMQYLECARVAGVYTNKELFERIAQLCESDPSRAETRLMLAHAAFRVVPPVERYELYCRAVEVAEAMATGDGSPITMSCAAEGHLGAAMLAKLLAEKVDAEKYRPLVSKHISDGMRAGGTWEMFKGVVESPKKPEAPSANGE